MLDERKVKINDKTCLSVKRHMEKKILRSAFIIEKTMQVCMLSMHSWRIG